MTSLRRQAEAIKYPCPTCGAEPGQPCDLGTEDLPPSLIGRSHASRERAVPNVKRGKRGSVRAIPTAFETNRRRH